MAETDFIHRFQQSRPKILMNRKRRINHLLGNLFRFRWDRLKLSHVLSLS